MRLRCRWWGAWKGGGVGALILQSCNAGPERIDGKLRDGRAIELSGTKFTIDRANGCGLEHLWYAQKVAAG
jgi:hypothetical protein